MQLKDYIQGNRRGKEANRLEREAMSDPFLQAALDGFDSVAGDHAKIIEDLEKKCTNIVETWPAASLPRRTYIYWAAASVLLLIGFQFFFSLKKNETNFPVIAQTESIENDVTPNDSSESLPKETLIAANTDKEIKKTIQFTEVKAVDKEVISVADMFMEDASASMAADVSVADYRIDESAKLAIKEQHVSLADTEQAVVLASNNITLDEVVAIGYGTQKKSELTGKVAGVNTSVENTSLRESISKINEKQILEDKPQSIFGKKEFRDYCIQKANKNICGGESVTIKISFFIDETGKPTEIEYKHFSCEEAKKEMDNLLFSSPAWTKTKRKVNMNIQW